MSAGIAIMLAGDERYAAPDTRFMIHELETFLGGSNSALQTGAKECDKLMKRMAEIYAEHTVTDRASWLRRMKKGEYNFDTKKALEYKVIQHVSWQPKNV